MLAAIAPKHVGRIWPNGKFGVSRLRETPFPSLCESHRETAESEFNRLGIKAHGVMAVLEFRGLTKKVCDPDLSNVSKSPIRAKRGHGGITRHGRNLISSAAVVAEERYDRRLLTFGTVTLPSVEPEYLKLIAENWSIVVKRFVKNLTRGLRSKELPSLVFGVTEIQEGRLAKFGVPALHLHFVFVGRNSRKSSWQVNRKNIRRWWKQALSPYVPTDTDYSSVENVQAIRKSAAAYLGKYMTKGASAIAKLVESGFADWIPSAWYTITHEFRRLVLSKVLSGEQVGEFLNWICHNVMAGWINWVSPVLISRSDGSQYSIGFGGRFSSMGLKKVQEIFVSAKITTVNGSD